MNSGMKFCRTCVIPLSPAEALIHSDLWPGHYIVSADEIEENQQEEK